MILLSLLRVLMHCTDITHNIVQYLLIGIIQYQSTFTHSRVKFMIDEDKTEYFIRTINICQLSYIYLHNDIGYYAIIHWAFWN